MERVFMMPLSLVLQIRLFLEQPQHLGQGEPATGVLGGLLVAVLPAALVVPLERLLVVAAGAVTLAGPEHGVGDQLVLAELLDEVLERLARLRVLLVLVEALADPEAHLGRQLVGVEALQELLADLENK